MRQTGIWAVAASAALAALLASAALCRGDEMTAQPSVRMTAKDDGGTVSLPAKGLLEVALEGNITTGYGWDLAETNTNVLRMVGSPYYQPVGGRLGAPGVFILRFEGVGSGKAALKLAYRRPFEKDKPPAKTFDATITVGP